MGGDEELDWTLGTGVNEKGAEKMVTTAGREYQITAVSLNPAIWSLGGPSDESHGLDHSLLFTNFI